MKLKFAKLIKQLEGGPFSLKPEFSAPEYRLEMLENGCLYVQRDPHQYLYPAGSWHGEPLQPKAVRAAEKTTADTRAEQRAARPGPGAKKKPGEAGKPPEAIVVIDPQVKENPFEGMEEYTAMVGASGDPRAK